MSITKINKAIEALELSLQNELRMINPNKIKSLTLMDTLTCLVAVVKEEAKEIEKRDFKFTELEEKFKELETKYSELIIKDIKDN